MKVIPKLLLPLFVIAAVSGAQVNGIFETTEKIMVYLAKRPHHPVTDYVLGKWLSRQGTRIHTDICYGLDGHRMKSSSTIYPFIHFLSRHPEVIPTFDRLAAQPYWFERTPILTLCHLASKDRHWETPNPESETYARIMRLPADKQKLFEITHWSKRSTNWASNYPRRLIDFK